MATSSYTRDKMSRFFNKLEDEAALAGDWSRVDLWRDVSHWLEKNVCADYEAVISQVDEVAALNSELEAAEGQLLEMQSQIDTLSNDLKDAEMEIESLKCENDRLLDQVESLQAKIEDVRWSDDG